MKTDDHIATALGISNDVNDNALATIAKTELIEYDAEDSSSVNYAKDRREDYEYTRDKLKSLVDVGTSAVTQMLKIAETNEEARSFEVVATLLKTVTDTTKELYDLQKKVKELEELNNKVADTQNFRVEKAVFIGTATDALDAIKNENNDELQK